MKIHDWRELNLQSLDQVLCAGEGKFSKAIHKFQRLIGAPPEAAQITHEASVAGRMNVFVQESTTLNWDGQKGVQQHLMSSWLPHYNGRVWIRKLDFERTKKYYRNDWGFWEVHKDDPYESGIPGALELLLAGLRMHRYVRKVWPSYTPKFTKEPHCTEHGARRIREHQLWIKPVVINRMPPWFWLVRPWMNY
ncbi:hypothetical protein LCGC14_1146160 [marine sediment metagenome]|uniref:Uncharacterized protein n=1 Tax=marine sediment metagenome TaxID=412755 RepID=A0A0F9MJZ3_9ZZZZ